MRTFRRFDNTNNILEINEVSDTYIKSSRYYLNQHGCYDKLSSHICNITPKYLETRKKCLQQLKDAEDWHTAVVLGL
tara:strand:- start:371 stop:601 length:231 start_codon:yes stop_codon:yes gene_type:complete